MIVLPFFPLQKDVCDAACSPIPEAEREFFPQSGFPRDVREGPIVSQPLSGTTFPSAEGGPRRDASMNTKVEVSCFYRKMLVFNVLPVLCK